MCGLYLYLEYQIQQCIELSITAILAADRRL